MGLDDKERDCERPRCVVIGAGPAGLTAAYELSGNGVNAVVLEQDDIVGGISRTVEHNGYRFDIGGHRFFSKVPLINQWWTSILGDDFQPRSRLSRIYYNGKFFDYPLRPSNALRGLGLAEAIMIMASYVNARTFPTAEEQNFEEWVCNRFGRRLFDMFFKTYTEKVWGMKCSRDRRRVGLAAHQKSRFGDGAKRHARRPQGRYHHPDQAVSLSSPWTGHDVGEGHPNPQGTRREGLPRPQGRQGQPLRRHGVVGHDDRLGRQKNRDARRSSHFFHADQGIDLRHDPRAALTRCAKRQSNFATVISSPWA